MATVQLEIPEKLIWVFEGEADTRGAYGGRGSAKTRTFARMTAVRAHMAATAGREGIILCGRQFMNSLADSSLEEIKAAIRDTSWLTPHFELGEKYIKHVSGRVSYSFAGLDRNVDSVKSKSRILLCWVDEAEQVTEDAWMKLDPTLREEDSELWVTWNPQSKRSATHKRFRETSDPRTRVVEMNWRDNPWFPDILERKRLKCLNEQPELYQHIWEGAFMTVQEGAYFAKSLTEAQAQGRIGNVAIDPLMQVRAIWDIGGTGAKADACSIWIAQFVGREIRVLDYYEAKGQPLASHVAWLRERGYGSALCVLPHDGATHDRVFDVSYESALKEAGFSVVVVPNQGKGAANMRIEAARRMFPRTWFNAATTEPGREALGAYHEKTDAERGVGLGPEHDWSSHAADAFGLMCVVYEEPSEALKPPERPAYTAASGWMGA